MDLLAPLEQMQMTEMNAQRQQLEKEKEKQAEREKEKKAAEGSSMLPITARFSSYLRENIGENRLSHCPPHFLVGDRKIQLLYFIIWSPKLPKIVFLFSNESADTLNEISGKIRFSDNLKANFIAHSDFAVENLQNPTEFAFQIPSLIPNFPVAMICETSLENLSYHISVTISFSYQTYSSPDPLASVIPLQICDFIRFVFYFFNFYNFLLTS